MNYRDSEKKTKHNMRRRNTLIVGWLYCCCCCWDVVYKVEAIKKLEEEFLTGMLSWSGP